MIHNDQASKILRLYHGEKWRIGEIARSLGVHHSVVRRVLRKDGSVPQGKLRPSIADPFLPFVLESLEKYPAITAARIYHMVKERGYLGRPGHFRAIVARLRPRPHAEAYLRLRTLPGEQAQADWAHFGKLKIGKAERPLWAFVMVLSYSRALFLRFYPGSHTAYFLQGHCEAFRFWNGSVRVVLYDNLKSVVLERKGDAIRFHPQILSLAAHYRFEPRPVAVARGNEKGRVERAIRYVRDAFFSARSWRDLEDLNRQADEWARTDALARPWPEDKTLSVKDAFQKERLLEPPHDDFACEERVEVSVSKTPYARFDLNDYSVPHTHVRKTLVVLATLDRVRVLDGQSVIATHRRSFEKGAVIEDPLHIEKLVEEKRAARKERSVDRLSAASPSSQELLVRLSQRGEPLRAALRALLSLLDLYGSAELEAAVLECLRKDVPHPHAVRHVLEKRRADTGQDAALPLTLPDDVRVRDLVIPPPNLKPYDHLKENHHDDDDDNDGVPSER